MVSAIEKQAKTFGCFFMSFVSRQLFRFLLVLAVYCRVLVELNATL